MSRRASRARSLPLFVHAGMLEEEFVSRLLERRMRAEPARLRGFRLVEPAAAGGPHLVADEGAVVDGFVYRDLEAGDYERLDAYVGVAEGLYERRTARLLDPAPAGSGGGEKASVYVPTPRQLRQAARLAAPRRYS